MWRHHSQDRFLRKELSLQHTRAQESKKRFHTQNPGKMCVLFRFETISYNCRGGNPSPSPAHPCWGQLCVAQASCPAARGPHPHGRAPTEPGLSDEPDRAPGVPGPFHQETADAHHPSSSRNLCGVSPPTHVVVTLEKLGKCLRRHQSAHASGLQRQPELKLGHM